MGPEVVLPWLIEQGGFAATTLFWLIIVWIIGKTTPAKYFARKMLVEPTIHFLLQELMGHINAHFDDLRERLEAGSANFQSHDERLTEIEKRLNIGHKL